MSDIDPDLPDYLVDAILSEEPPAEAVDLVKNAFTWRTIDAELMELSYDSVIDVAGVRDASGRRTLEFSAATMSVVIEVDFLRVLGVVSPGADGTVRLSLHDEVVVTTQVESGRFDVSAPEAGAVRLTLEFEGATFALPAFAVG